MLCQFPAECAYCPEKHPAVPQVFTRFDVFGGCFEVWLLRESANVVPIAEVNVSVAGLRASWLNPDRHEAIRLFREIERAPYSRFKAGADRVVGSEDCHRVGIAIAETLELRNRPANRTQGVLRRRLGEDVPVI